MQQVGDMRRLALMAEMGLLARTTTPGMVHFEGKVPTLVQAHGKGELDTTDRWASRKQPTGLDAVANIRIARDDEVDSVVEMYLDGSRKGFL